MFQLVYVSSAIDLFDKDELVEILATSRSNNIDRDVTGFLLYQQGKFFQLLEGERATVEEIYGRIKDDDRHFGAIILMTREIGERQFPDWSMAFEDLDDNPPEAVMGFSEYLLNSDVPAADGVDARLDGLIANFRASVAR